MHRNVNLENVFLDCQGYWGIDNFQNAKELAVKTTFRTFTIVGTPHYFAPEIVNGKGYYFEVDYWALGVMLYKILYGKFPFGNQSNDPFDIFKQIIKNNA